MPLKHWRDEPSLPRVSEPLAPQPWLSHLEGRTLVEGTVLAQRDPHADVLLNDNVIRIQKVLSRLVWFPAGADSGMKIQIVTLRGNCVQGLEVYSVRNTQGVELQSMQHR
jgi:hypothetical protein